MKEDGEAMASEGVQVTPQPSRGRRDTSHLHKLRGAQGPMGWSGAHTKVSGRGSLPRLLPGMSQEILSLGSMWETHPEEFISGATFELPKGYGHMMPCKLSAFGDCSRLLWDS